MLQVEKFFIFLDTVLFVIMPTPLSVSFHLLENEQNRANKSNIRNCLKWQNKDMET